MADSYSHVLANAIIGSGTKQNVPSLNMTLLPVPPYRGAGCKDGGPERPPIEADQQTGTSAADTSAAGTSAADACVANTSFAATGAAETNTLQDRSVSNDYDPERQHDGSRGWRGTESYPDISSDEASSPFTLLDSPIDAIGDRSRGSTRTPDTERGSRSRSQRRPGRPRK
ncbi:hypothetical protein quinque_006101 [Culex quinquefasciatus]